MGSNQKVPKMVRYQNGVEYSITICPDDKLQFRTKADRFHHYGLWLSERYSDYFQGIASLKLWPDVSFPEVLTAGKYPRIHYHGIVIFDDVYRFLLSTQIDDHHRVEIDTIADRPKWKKYCTKLLDNVEIKGVKPRVLTHTNLKPLLTQVTNPSNILAYLDKNGS